MPITPEYRNNRDDAPRAVAAMAKTSPDGSSIPLHIHKRGQLIHAQTGVMRIETAQRAWIVSPALALWMPPEYPHAITIRGRLEMRTVYIRAAECESLPKEPMLAEIGGLMRELILAALEEPLDYAEHDRGGLVAQLILAELAQLRARPLDLPMPHDPRALRVARDLLREPELPLGLDDFAQRAGASRRTLARLFRSETGFGFAEWRARLRAIDGLARLSSGNSVAAAAAAVGYASPSAFSAMVRRNFGDAPRGMRLRA